jgi:hypothetical protein
VSKLNSALRAPSDRRVLSSYGRREFGGFCRMGGGESRRLRSLPRNMLWLCHICEIDIKYPECRCAGGGIPVAARRAIPRAHPDYGDAGIYREGHRASSKAKPRRDATSVPKSCERLICRCRGQIGPESDGAAPASTRSHKASGHPGLAGDGPAMPSAQRLTNEQSGRLTERTARFSHQIHRPADAARAD